MRLRSLKLTWCVPLVLSAALLLPGASAGSAEAPELTDAQADCSVPHGNEYLDIVAAWIDGETADSFDVNLKLAKWTEAFAEGTGLTVQFTHQGVEWGVIGTFGQAIGGGWSFETGKASSEAATDFNETSGAFDPATATMTATFPKSIFPHTDMNDTQLKGIKALSADLRTAYPYFVAGLDGNGKWTTCDSAETTATYSFGGGHGGHVMPSTDASSGQAADQTADEVAPVAIEQPIAENDTPLAPILVLAAIALVALTRRRA